nr:uncharacterized protein LOC117278355 [Nicotiana tomentosiformis]
MRKVIAVDGIFLTGKYRGVLLSVVAQDSKNHIFSVAFCVVDKECDAAYEYLYEQLSSIHPESIELCINSDRNISIANGISKFYPQAHHGFCMRHLAENIHKNFHCGDFLYHYYSAAKAYRIDDFNDNFQQIKDNNVRVAKYLEEDIGFHKWSKAHFPSNRYVLHQLGNPSINHTYWEQNMVADRLAKQLFESITSINTTVYYAAPTFVLDLLHADMHGPPYVRRVSPT